MILPHMTERKNTYSRNPVFIGMANLWLKYGALVDKCCPGFCDYIQYSVTRNPDTVGGRDK